MKYSIIRLFAKFTGIVVFFFSAPVSVFPQQVISAKAGNIQWIQGEVFLNRTSLLLKDGQYLQMDDGQVLTTGKGYAEMLLAPDAYLRLGESASLRMRQNSLADILLELKRGSALVEILKKLKTDPIRVHVSDSVVEIKKEGLYRLDAESRMLRVYCGDARVVKGGKKVRVKNSRVVSLDGELEPDKFNVKDVDALHLWAAQRSFALSARDLFFTKPVNPRQLTWRSRPDGIYNPHYHVTVAANEDWNRYWLGVLGVFTKWAQKTRRRMNSDPGSIFSGHEIQVVEDSDGNATVK
ncbi:MAG: hypothetical protein JXR49_07335 [Acidobacteria bacterium]|nr:hypothetical protein [Acidobacteriota bacterium]